MSDTDLQYQLMLEGRLNLMHLPPGAIAWLWDRPAKQIQAAEDLGVAANAHGNPIVDASLLKADQNVLLIKCEGGECFRVYPDGGYSFDEAPMDIGGCSSVLQGGGCDTGCPMDELGHQEVMDSYGNDEHMDTVPPESGVAAPEGMTNLAGEPTMDEDQGGDWGGPGATTMGGTGTGTPYVGDLDPHVLEAEFLNDLARAIGVEGIIAEQMTYRDMEDKYGRDDDSYGPAAPPEETSLEVYDDATDTLKEVFVGLDWEIQPTEYDGPFVFVHGGATLHNMKLLQPLEVNGIQFTGLNEQLAALILASDQIEAEPGKAWETLRDRVEDKEAQDYTPPTSYYPDSRGR